ncbi:MAG TPA: hypothetical protein DCL81_15770, partial [Algoriphagus sp.]|nr:hypothetical protein [Algoriphagus sp.]
YFRILEDAVPFWVYPKVSDVKHHPSIIFLPDLPDFFDYLYAYRLTNLLLIIIKKTWQTWQESKI